MRIEVYPAKYERNIGKHGISLQATKEFDWDTAFEREDVRFDYGEVCFVAIGLIGDDLQVLAFTDSSHDDNPPMDAAFMAGMKPSRRGRAKLEAPKVEVRIRLDAKTVEHLRGSGPGWQTRVNALLGKLVASGRV